MFTGLTEAMGTVVASSPRREGLSLQIHCPEIAGDLTAGESVAIDGCCLTVEASDAEGFSCFASPETLEKTTLDNRPPGSRVNLERALALGDRLGGHLVQGHVDGLGTVESLESLGESWRLTVSFPDSLAPFLVEKGSVAVDGISLTAFDVMDSMFSVAVIPETWATTTLQFRAPGDSVHLEMDLIGKYVARQMALGQGGETRGVTEDTLRRAGFIPAAKGGM